MSSAGLGAFEVDELIQHALGVCLAPHAHVRLLRQPPQRVPIVDVIENALRRHQRPRWRGHRPFGFRGGARKRLAWAARRPYHHPRSPTSATSPPTKSHFVCKTPPYRMAPALRSEYGPREVRAQPTGDGRAPATGNAHDSRYQISSTNGPDLRTTPVIFYFTRNSLSAFHSAHPRSRECRTT